MVSPIHRTSIPPIQARATISQIRSQRLDIMHTGLSFKKQPIHSLARYDSIPPRRKQDRNLMANIGHKKYSKRNQEHINNCRLYLRVEYLSDICNEAGIRSCRKPWIGMDQERPHNQKSYSLNRHAQAKDNGHYSVNF